MQFNPLEFLTLAETLSDDVNYQTESGFRTSVGRAYYAAFHTVKAWLEGDGWKPRKKRGRTHQQVIHALKDLDTTAGSLLKKLFDLRVRSDYKLHKHVGAEFVGESIQLSKEIQTRIEAANIPGPP